MKVIIVKFDDYGITSPSSVIVSNDDIAESIVAELKAADPDNHYKVEIWTTDSVESAIDDIKTMYNFVKEDEA